MRGTLVEKVDLCTPAASYARYESLCWFVNIRTKITLGNSRLLSPCLFHRWRLLRKSVDSPNRWDRRVSRVIWGVWSQPTINTDHIWAPQLIPHGGYGDSNLTHVELNNKGSSVEIWSQPRSRKRPCGMLSHSFRTLPMITVHHSRRWFESCGPQSTQTRKSSRFRYAL